MKKKNPLSSLLAHAQETENLASETSAVTPTNLPIDNDELPSTPKGEKSNSPQKDLIIYFSRKNDKSTEPTRLPINLHKKLKLISIASGISIEALVANMIEKTLQDYEKEINSYLKKNLNI